MSSHWYNKVLIWSCNWIVVECKWAVLGWAEMTEEEKRGTNESHEVKREIKWWKERCAATRPEWDADGTRGRERVWALASHFVDRLNKSIKACWSTLIELHKWVRRWGGTLMLKLLQSKAAIGVGRPQLQALSEINHPCQPLLALLFLYPLIYPSGFFGLEIF